MIPMHPQACPDQPDRLRWIIPAGLLPFTGRPAAVPESLGSLLAEGTLAGVLVEPNAIVTVLGAERSWSRDGARIRTALHLALDEVSGWRPTGQAGYDPDEQLRAAAQELIDGRAGRLARSHGGRIDLLDAADGVLRVRLGGACNGCPAAQNTLRQQLEQALRQQFPHLRAVTTERAAVG